jgi:hypothetical protein
MAKFRSFLKRDGRKLADRYSPSVARFDRQIPLGENGDNEIHSPNPGIHREKTHSAILRLLLYFSVQHTGKIWITNLPPIIIEKSWTHEIKTTGSFCLNPKKRRLSLIL